MYSRFCLGSQSVKDVIVLIALGILVFFQFERFSFSHGKPENCSRERGGCTQISKVLENSKMNWIANLTRHAEERWLQGSGYMWLQHARKAGGTSLCMILRENTYGLVQSKREQRAPLPRETCQMKYFCIDCDLKTRYPNASDLSSNVRYAMLLNGRNFIETEGNGVPEDILSEAWSDFVFVSSIRHPLARIESAIQNDRRYNECNPRRVGRQRSAACLSKFVKNNRTILQQCESGIYHCFSNYYVRMFSGREKNYTTDAEMLALAKENFLRFSCVLLQEEWDTTQSCLWRKLGLSRRSPSAYNVNGIKDSRKDPGDIKIRTLYNTSSVLLQDDFDRLKILNHADLMFYEWARETIINDNLNR